MIKTQNMQMYFQVTFLDKNILGVKKDPNKGSCGVF